MPVIFKDTVSHFKKNSISEESTPKSLCQVQIFLNRPFIDVVH